MPCTCLSFHLVLEFFKYLSLPQTVCSLGKRFLIVFLSLALHIVWHTLDAPHVSPDGGMPLVSWGTISRENGEAIVQNPHSGQKQGLISELEIPGVL